MLFRVVNRLKSDARLTENNTLNRILNKYVTDKTSHYRVLICKFYIPEPKTQQTLLLTMECGKFSASVRYVFLKTLQESFPNVYTTPGNA